MQKIKTPLDINQTEQEEIGIFNTMIASGPVIIQQRDGVLKTLLVKHGNKPLHQLKWKFCGGKLLKGWTLKENTIREAKEEIGIKINIIRELPTIELWQESPETGNQSPELIILIHYLATINSDPIKTKKILDLSWFDIDNLPPGSAPNIKPIIAAYKKIKHEL